jgi:hypothetical protein
MRNLNEISDLLESTLQASGYSERAFYSIPGGFAIVTRLEQTYADGRPLPGPNRWATTSVPAARFSIPSYLKALLQGRSGYFRVIVFGVTAQPFSQSVVTVTEKETLGWIGKGLNSLPPSIGIVPVGERVRITALVYEFELSDLGGPPNFAFPGRLSGTEHLTASGILASLTR